MLAFSKHPSRGRRRDWVEDGHLHDLWVYEARRLSAIDTTKTLAFTVVV